MTEEQTVAGVGIFVAAYTTEDAADEALKALKEAKKQKQVYFEDAAVVRQDDKGKVHYHETGDMSTGKGTGIGALVGGIVGILAGPAGVVAGAGIGAVSGAIASLRDSGFDDDSLKELGAALKPGTSALAAVTSHDFLKAMRKNVDEADALAAVKQLGAGISAQLEAGANVGYGMALTEEGVSVVALAADDTTAQIMGVAATEEGVAGAAAVATEEGVAVKQAVVTEEGAAVRGAVVTDDAAAAGAAVAVPEEKEDK